MRIWINSNLKQREKNIVKDVLEGCHNSHFLVDIVEPWKLKWDDEKIIQIVIWCISSAE